jgi:phosphoribosylformylglycinamidine synthase PurS subunit
MKDRRSKTRFNVLVTIQNKPYLGDPEGETVLKNLVLKEGYSDVESIRSAKTFRITLSAHQAKEAKAIVYRMCEELRIFNPVVSDCSVKVIGKG